MEEAHTFLTSSEKDRYYIAFLLALTTGMRQGEILGLRWKDVNSREWNYINNPNFKS
ncbi:tyrosine-type recombinase/integrase [Brevibacillus laterosporus]|uniref:tyrosine-type recombinase/integrase n=1 Tax=Brevibacillus laterosporus TaxID=1465 RepID=UPI003D1C21C8